MSVRQKGKSMALPVRIEFISIGLFAELINHYIKKEL